ncbi:hypothetical protein HAX54_002606, partial [Datura stramonium]|nr:hypothetical protein [Datura stramonium]
GYKELGPCLEKIATFEVSMEKKIDRIRGKINDLMNSSVSLPSFPEPMYNS